MNGGPRALVFDFDGLIMDTEAAEHASVAAIFAEHGCELPLDRWKSVIGTSQPDFFWIDWLEEVAGGRISRSLLQIEQRQRNDLLVARLTVNAGVVDLLDAAEANNVPCAVASSSPARWVRPHLDRLGLLDRFMTIVTREDAKQAKPAPDLYVEALRRLDVTDTRTGVAFEDSRMGSLAAIAAGMTCVVCPHALTDTMDLSHAHYRTDSLAAIDWQLLSSLTINRTVAA
jgi:HAD superfamily hydrolase (TIGR01509 family)